MKATLSDNHQRVGFKYIPGDNTESQVSSSLSLFAWLQKF